MLKPRPEHINILFSLPPTTVMQTTGKCQSEESSKSIISNHTLSSTQNTVIKRIDQPFSIKSTQHQMNGYCKQQISVNSNHHLNEKNVYVSSLKKNFADPVRPASPSMSVDSAIDLSHDLLSNPGSCKSFEQDTKSISDLNESVDFINHNILVKKNLVKPVAVARNITMDPSSVSLHSFKKGSASETNSAFTSISNSKISSESSSHENISLKTNKEKKHFTDESPDKFLKPSKSIDQSKSRTLSLCTPEKSISCQSYLYTTLPAEHTSSSTQLHSSLNDSVSIIQNGVGSFQCVVPKPLYGVSNAIFSNNSKCTANQAVSKPELASNCVVSSRNKDRLSKISNTPPKVKKRFLKNIIDMKRKQLNPKEDKHTNNINIFQKEDGKALNKASNEKELDFKLSQLDKTGAVNGCLPAHNGCSTEKSIQLSEVMFSTVDSSHPVVNDILMTCDDELTKISPATNQMSLSTSKTLPFSKRKRKLNYNCNMKSLFTEENPNYSVMLENPPKEFSDNISTLTELITQKLKKKKEKQEKEVVDKVSTNSSTTEKDSQIDSCSTNESRQIDRQSRKMVKSKAKNQSKSSNPCKLSDFYLSVNSPEKQQRIANKVIGKETDILHAFCKQINSNSGLNITSEKRKQLDYFAVAEKFLIQSGSCSSTEKLYSKHDTEAKTKCFTDSSSESSTPSFESSGDSLKTSADYSPEQDYYLPELSFSSSESSPNPTEPSKSPKPYEIMLEESSYSSEQELSDKADEPYCRALEESRKGDNDNDNDVRRSCRVSPCSVVLKDIIKSAEMFYLDPSDDDCIMTELNEGMKICVNEESSEVLTEITDVMKMRIEEPISSPNPTDVVISTTLNMKQNDSVGSVSDKDNDLVSLSNDKTQRGTQKKVVSIEYSPSSEDSTVSNDDDENGVKIDVDSTRGNQCVEVRDAINIGSNSPGHVLKADESDGVKSSKHLSISKQKKKIKSDDEVDEGMDISVNEESSEVLTEITDFMKMRIEEPISSPNQTDIVISTTLTVKQNNSLGSVSDKYKDNDLVSLSKDKTQIGTKENVVSIKYSLSSEDSTVSNDDDENGVKSNVDSISGKTHVEVRDAIKIGSNSPGHGQKADESDGIKSNKHLSISKQEKKTKSDDEVLRKRSNEQKCKTSLKKGELDKQGVFLSNDENGRITKRILNFSSRRKTSQLEKLSPSTSQSKMSPHSSDQSTSGNESSSSAVPSTDSCTCAKIDETTHSTIKKTKRQRNSASNRLSFTTTPLDFSPNKSGFIPASSALHSSFLPIKKSSRVRTCTLRPDLTPRKFHVNFNNNDDDTIESIRRPDLENISAVAVTESLADDEFSALLCDVTVEDIMAVECIPILQMQDHVMLNNVNRSENELDDSQDSLDENDNNTDIQREPLYSSMTISHVQLEKSSSIELNLQDTSAVLSKNKTKLYSINKDNMTSSTSQSFFQSNYTSSEEQIVKVSHVKRNTIGRGGRTSKQRSSDNQVIEPITIRPGKMVKRPLILNHSNLDKPQHMKSVHTKNNLEYLCDFTIDSPYLNDKSLLLEKSLNTSGENVSKSEVNQSSQCVSSTRSVMDQPKPFIENMAIRTECMIVCEDNEKVPYVFQYHQNKDNPQPSTSPSDLINKRMHLKNSNKGLSKAPLPVFDVECFARYLSEPSLDTSLMEELGCSPVVDHKENQFEEFDENKRKLFARKSIDVLCASCLHVISDSNLSIKERKEISISGLHHSETFSEPESDDDTHLSSPPHKVILTDNEVSVGVSDFEVTPSKSVSTICDKSSDNSSKRKRYLNTMFTSMIQESNIVNVNRSSVNRVNKHVTIKSVNGGKEYLPRRRFLYAKKL